MLLGIDLIGQLACRPIGLLAFTARLQQLENLLLGDLHKRRRTHLTSSGSRTVRDRTQADRVVDAGCGHLSSSSKLFAQILVPARSKQMI